MHRAELATEKLPESTDELNPRDGMSRESAKLAISRCADNSEYELMADII
jgi:hypothetical protein